MQLPPKQYAQELIEKYLNPDIGLELSKWERIKCALIDVQNTIDYAKTFGDVTNTDIEYFNQVITELQNS